MIQRAINLLYCAVITAAFSVALTAPASAQESTASVATGKVLDHHLQAFGSGDMEAILSDYTADSVLMTPGGTLRGQDELRPLFQTLFTEFAKPGATFAISQRVIEGEVAYIVWTAETADNVYELATDTFVVRNGKIVAQSFAAKVTAKN
jgi:hypothetical protein